MHSKEMLAVRGRALMQNAMLRRRLSAQLERMNATKRSMKSIHDRLEANNERKQQLIGSLRRSRDLALIQQRNLSLYHLYRTRMPVIAASPSVEMKRYQNMISGTFGH